MRSMYFENPGMPTDEERGTYCPHGEKVAEFPAGQPWKSEVVEPWPCGRPGCTRGEFEQAKAEMEADLAEAEKHAWGCMFDPDHTESCKRDRGDLS